MTDRFWLPARFTSWHFASWGGSPATLPVSLGPRILTMKVRDLLKLLAHDDWYLVRTRGSHQQFKHPTKPGLVTVVGKPSDEIAPGTLNSILKQAGLK